MTIQPLPVLSVGDLKKMLSDLDDRIPVSICAVTVDCHTGRECIVNSECSLARVSTELRESGKHVILWREI